MKKIILGFSALIVFTVFNGAIYQKEQIKAKGETVYLELAPADPRSLMQGDYMRLRYAVENAAPSANERRKGRIVVTLDQNKVGAFSRMDDGSALGENEKKFNAHQKYNQWRIVPDSFFFQEGHAKEYERAKYGVFKMSAHGDYLLVGLADEALNLIKAQ
jgi:uncharacterized membrane-anchored protein